MQTHLCSPEDYLSIWQWMSFTWLSPIVAKGKDTSTRLEESDVWEFSPTLGSRATFGKFAAIP
jgi:hypothetical protein